MTTPALGALNEYEAATAAAKYQYDNELARAYGPYTYLNHPYFYVEFATAGTTTGVVIVDGISGNLVDNTDTARKISYTHNVLKDIDSSSVSSDAQDAADFRQLSKEMRDLNDEIDKNQLTTSIYLNESEKQQMRDLSRVIVKMEISITNFANTLDKQVIAERDVLNGNKSYENSVKITNGYKEMARNADELIPIFKEFESIIGESLGIAELEVYNDELKRVEQELQRSVNWDISSMESRKNSVPGFGVLLAICAVLITGVLIQKRRK